MKHLKIRSSRQGGAVVVRLEGDFELASQETARAALDELSGPGVRMVLDLEALDYIDSAGLGLLIGTLKRLKEKGGTLAIARPKAHVQGIFRLIKLSSLMGVHPTLEEALAGE